MILVIVLACEVGFWILLLLGLAARYVLRRPRVGLVLLLAVPVVDLVLLVAVGADLHAGGEATFAHALAAIYLGFSIAYGHRMIRWADVRFAHRFAQGPPPARRYGGAYARACWLDVLRTAAAVGIAAGVLWLLVRVAAEGTDTEALSRTYGLLGVVLLVEVLWALAYTIWPKKAVPGGVGAR